MAGPITARGGKVDKGATASGPWTNIPEVRSWQLNPKTEAKRYASSSTAGASRRLVGVDDFDGTVELYVDQSARFDDDAGLNIRSGQTMYLKMYESPGANFFIAPIYVDDVAYSVPIEDGDPIPATINFSGNGAIIYP